MNLNQLTNTNAQTISSTAIPIITSTPATTIAVPQPISKTAPQTTTINLANANIQNKNIQIINNVTSATILNSIPQGANITFSLDNSNIKPSNLKINQISSSTFTVIQPTASTTSTVVNTAGNQAQVTAANNQVTSSNSATSTQSNNSNTSSSSTSSYGGFAYCSNCGEYGVKAAFYGKSKLYCSVACQNGIKKQQQQQQQQSHGIKRTAEALNYSPINTNTNTVITHAPITAIQPILHATNTNATITTTAATTNTPANVPISLQPSLISNIITIQPANTELPKESLNTFMPMKSGSTTISTYLSQQINSASNQLAAKLTENVVNSQASNSNDTNILQSSVILSSSLTNSQTSLNGNPAKRPRKVSTSNSSIESTHSNPPTTINKILNTTVTPTTSSSLTEPKVSPSSSTKVTTATAAQCFSWCDYIEKNKFDVAPVWAFKHAPLVDLCKKLMIDLRVEVPNSDTPPENLLSGTPNHKKCYWFALMVDYAGYFIKLRYIGYENDASDDFWMHIADEEIRHVGWCKENGYSLVPPMKIGYNVEDWGVYVYDKLIDSKTIPKDFQSEIKDSLSSDFKRGMLLELVDKKKLSRMRIARVIENTGRRLRLKYENTNEFDDFWCHEQSSLIHPIGWSATHGHEIYAPDEYKKQSIIKYENNSYEMNEARPKMFIKSRENDVENFKGKFKVNMKLEAIDPLNLSQICVATVAKVLAGGYLMIAIDGYKSDDGNDIFCYHRTSSCIFPAGFCKSNNLPLQPPYNYKKPFDWPTYLRETNSEFAPKDLFYKDSSFVNPFKIGMKLESVDLIEPKMICVATVVSVVNRLIKINFDGWDEKFDQWIDCETCDIYPVGWCQMVGYKLEDPPLKQPESEMKKEKGGKKSKKK